MLSQEEAKSRRRNNQQTNTERDMEIQKSVGEGFAGDQEQTKIVER